MPEQGGFEKEMCSYLGAETVAVDNARPQKSVTTINIAVIVLEVIVAAFLAILTG